MLLNIKEQGQASAASPLKNSFQELFSGLVTLAALILIRIYLIAFSIVGIILLSILTFCLTAFAYKPGRRLGQAG
jgi:hypothetical protein